MLSPAHKGVAREGLTWSFPMCRWTAQGEGAHLTGDSGLDDAAHAEDLAAYTLMCMQLARTIAHRLAPDIARYDQLAREDGRSRLKGCQVFLVKQVAPKTEARPQAKGFVFRQKTENRSGHRTTVIRHRRLDYHNCVSILILILCFRVKGEVASVFFRTEQVKPSIKP